MNAADDRRHLGACSKAYAGAVADSRNTTGEEDTGEDSSAWQPVMVDGVQVGRASIEYGVATVQILPGREGVFRAGLVGGFSLAVAVPAGAPNPSGVKVCWCRPGLQCERCAPRRTVASMDPELAAYLAADKGGPEPEAVPCDGSAACPAGRHLLGCYGWTYGQTSTVAAGGWREICERPACCSFPLHGVGECKGRA